MRYCVVFTLVSGFALFAGRASVGQVPNALENGVPAGQTSPATQAASTGVQAANTNDSTAAAHWWQRFAPPAGANEKTAAPAATAAVPVTETAPPAPASSWYFGKLLQGNDKKDEKIDPFAVKAASYEERVSSPAVVAGQPNAPNQSSPTPPPNATDKSSMALTGGLIAANTPAVSATNNGAVPVDGANGCPYPDTGIQALYQPAPSAPGALITDHATSPGQPQSAENVRGAFNGLLGRDDDRTKQEAAALPLLAPYKDLPVGFPHTATAVPSVKQERSGLPGNGTKMAAQAEKAAPASMVTQSDRYAEKSANDAKEKSVVDAAFNLPSSETKSQAATVQTSGSVPNATAASNQLTSPQPLQMNGVVAQQLTGTPLNRPKIIYHPGASVMDNAGHKLIKPEVQVAADSTASGQPSSVQLAQFAGAAEGTLPAPGNIAPETAFPIDEQQWMPAANGFDSGACDSCQDGHGGHLWNRGCRDCCRSGKLGTEYVMHAPFFIQTTEPFNNCRVRLDLAQDLEFPDRSEYFWAKSPGGKGPGGNAVTVGEPSVNYSDLSFFIEKGTKRLSIGTYLPIRAVDPEINDDAVGFGDMSVTTKAVLMDGTNWQLTQILNTYLPTGTAHHGTGNGHVSMEPGVAYRWKWSDWTYFHGDLKYLFPIGADPDFAGQIFNYGFGWSHVWRETDTWALMPTFEVECWTFVDGQQTPAFPLAPVPIEVNTTGIMNICPGFRWVCDKGCDCGKKEFGMSAGVSVTEDHLYEKILRLEMRWFR